MNKMLLIHETDSHGSGFMMYEGQIMQYWHEDGTNMRAAVNLLIEIGFIEKENVCILEGAEIYEFLNDALNDVEMLMGKEG